jgi:hypothetical protein
MAGNNIYQGQLKGPFKAKESIITKIKADAAVDISYVAHLGIITDIKNIININGEDIEIGKTGMYEIGNTEITSIYFQQDVDKNTIIDFVVEAIS